MGFDLRTSAKHTHNRGSGNTNNSNATTLDSNKRFSYASTVPSSIDSHDDEGDLPFQPRQKYAPVPRTNTESVDPEPQSRKTFSLKAAGRAFSFGAKSAKNIPQENQDVPPLPSRDRALTASSYASTATPPKLDLGGGSGLGLGDSDFGDIFSKRKSTIMEEPSSSASGSATVNIQAPTPSKRAQGSPYDSGPYNQQYQHRQYQQSSPSSDLHFPPRQQSYSTDNYPQRDAPPRRTGSPYSWKSGASEERLMASPHPQAYFDSPTFRPSPALQPDVDNSIVLDALNASRFLDSEHSPQPPRHIPETSTAARTHGPARPPPSAYRGPEPRRPSPLQESFTRTPQNQSDGFSDVDLTPQARGNVPVDDEPLFDAPRPRKPFFRGNARSATAPQQNSKVMTPAEFEEYKKHKENEPPEEHEDSESSSEPETYEDDDETERQKEAAKQRRRQEAHLAVYRQQMMKVTGEQPSELPPRPTRTTYERASNSAPALGSMSFENKTSPDPGKSSEDEDEEVPLGVLQAHGFPSKGRPPTRLSQSTSSVLGPESTATYPQPGGATRNDATAGGGGNPNLPVFAKHLPQDPYVGASLVNPPNRESLAFNQSAAPTPALQQQAQPPSASSGNLPPGGLVGVIATEERAKAMRRGSPNARGTYDPVPSMQLPHEVQQQQMMQQMMQQQAMQQQHSPNMMNPAISQPHAPNPMSAGEQSQVQVNQQMSQFLQMQMQWMQIMMQNNGNAPPGMQPPQLPQQSFSNPNFLGTDPMARPTSMASANSFGGHNRGVSSTSRGPSPNHMTGMPASSSQSVYGLKAPGAGYTPSIAPSERSTVGQPSRYRPVTPGGNQNRDSRTSSMSQQTVQGLPLRGQRSQSRLRNESGRDAPKPSIKAVEKPKHGRKASQDDEDDDEGWAEMQRQRQERQSRWKQSRGQSTVPGTQESGLEGLFYEGPHT